MNLYKTLIELTEKSEKEDSNLYNYSTISALQNFDFNTDKIKFINYFVDETDIYQKFLLYKHQYEQYE